MYGTWDFDRQPILYSLLNETGELQCPAHYTDNFPLTLGGTVLECIALDSSTLISDTDPDSATNTKLPWTGMDMSHGTGKTGQGTDYWPDLNPEQ